jgi:hypothetical protein
VNDILQQFKDHGMSASFHYADDTCKEWALASRRESAAMKLFDSHPELQDEMRVIASDFLWTLNRAAK